MAAERPIGYAAPCSSVDVKWRNAPGNTPTMRYTAGGMAGYKTREGSVTAYNAPQFLTDAYGKPFGEFGGTTYPFTPRIPNPTVFLPSDPASGKYTALPVGITPDGTKSGLTGLADLSTATPVS